MAAQPKVVRLSLVTDSTGQPRGDTCSGYTRLFVAECPDAAAGVALLGLDARPEIPIRRGRTFELCGGQIKRFDVAAPALGGEIVIILGTDDVRPFDGGGASDARTIDRLLDAWWLPHQPATSTGPFNFDGLAGSGLWAGLFSVEANVPEMSVRGHRCGRCLPAGGSSGVLSAISFPWQRKVTEANGRLTGRMAARAIEHRVSCNLTRLSTAAKTLGTGLQIAQGRGTAENLSGGNAGFGIVPGAGADAWWRFVSRAVDAGPLVIDIPLPRPAGVDATWWTRAGVAMKNANAAAGTDGSVTVYQNGIAIQTFTDMSLFPPAMDGAFTSTGFDVRVVDEGANVDSLFFSHFHQAIVATSDGSDE